MYAIRSYYASMIKDLKGNYLVPASHELKGDSDRGEAGVVSGIVQGPDGTPVPFAEIKYIQPIHHEGILEEWTKDCLISTIIADAEGRYQIDFVLMNSWMPENADQWLNKLKAGGTDHFKLEATDPVSGNIGKMSARILYDKQQMKLNIIIRGYGNIEGTVYKTDDESATPVSA